MNELLACPRCRGTLSADLRCAACARACPRLASVPMLFADPDAKLWEWRNMHALAAADLTRERERYKQALARDDLLPKTSSRLRAGLAAKTEWQKGVDELLAPLLDVPVGSVDALRLIAGKSSANQTLFGYVTNVFRDWGWPETTENADALRLVLEAWRATRAGPAAAGAAAPAAAAAGLPAAPRILVLGAGACRLAADVHAAAGAGTTIACDINPFYLLVAERLLAGKTLALPEFPLAADGQQNSAVTRMLAAPAAAPGLHLVLADAMDPPFAAGAFDLVLTPWFLDIVPQDTRQLAPKLNHLLRPGGVWVNFGSAVFQRAEPERCYGREELLDVVAGAGFAVRHHDLSVIDYLASPASCQTRREKVLTFGAAKTHDVAAAPPFKLLPDWLSDPSLPIPLVPAFADHVRAQMLFAAIVQLADGRNSANAIAAVVASSLKVPQEQALTTVTRFLAGLFEGQINRN